MGVVFVISGKSGAGKDTVMSLLLGGNAQKVSEERLSRWVPYTSRPMRPGETEGVEDHFVSHEDYERDLVQGLVAESRVYAHFKNDGREFPVAYYEKNDLDPDKNYIIAVPPDVVGKFKKYFEDKPEFKIHSVYLHLDPVERFERMYKREESGKKNFQEVGRRFLADEHDYGPEELIKTRWGVDDIVYNSSLTACVRTIEKRFSEVVREQNEEISREHCPEV